MIRNIAITGITVLAACGGEGALTFSDPNPWPDVPLLPAASGERLVFTNSGDDTLTFIAYPSLDPIAAIPVGKFPIEREGPHHLQASADGRVLYVGISNTVPLSGTATGPHGSHGTGTADGYLLKIDAVTGRLIDDTRVHRSPGDVRFDPMRRRIWQSHFDLVSVIEVIQGQRPRQEMDSYLVGINPDTMKKEVEVRVCPAGHGIGFTPDASAAYVSCLMSDELAIVNLTTLEVTRVFVGPNPGFAPAPRYQPYALAVSPADGRVFVSSTGVSLKGLTVYDPQTGAFDPALTITTPGAAQFGAFTKDGSRFYVATQRPDHLVVIDPATSSILDDVDLAPTGCVNTHLASLSADDATLFIVCEGDHDRVRGKVVVLDRATLGERGRADLGIYPDDVAVLPRAPVEALP